VLDNASFHQVDYSIWRDMEEKHLGIAPIVPAGCFMDPIEEFFGTVHALFHGKIDSIELARGVEASVSREEIYQNIIESVREASAAQDFVAIFHRAGL
jgi:hypothetical protein